MKLNNVDEATRVVESILKLRHQGVLSKKEAIAAVKRVEYYKDLLAK